MGVITELGQCYILNHIVKDSENWSLKLFQNKISPVSSDTFELFEEADFSGYSEVVPEGWMPAILNTERKAESFANSIIFKHNGGKKSNKIYGWYIVAYTEGIPHIILAKTFTKATQMSKANHTLVITPVLTFTTDNGN